MKKIKCLFIGFLLITFFIQTHAQNSKYWEEVAKKREESDRKKEKIRKMRYAAEQEMHQKEANSREKQTRCRKQCEEKFSGLGNMIPHTSCYFKCERDYSNEYLETQRAYQDLLYKLSKEEL